MKISVVMPVYNGARFLAATLDSVLSQTLSTWELIVVDDGSTDHSIAMASSYAARDERIRVVCQCNGGVAEARNRGYGEISSGSAGVVFLDHDDVWHPEALSILSAELSAHPQAVVAHALARMTDLLGKPYGSPEGIVMSCPRRKIAGNRIVTCSRVEPTTFSLLICDCCLCTPGIVLTRRTELDALAAEGQPLFDQGVAPGDDWDLWLRLSLRGDFAYVDRVLLDWRQHESNGSKQEDVTHAAESRVRRKVIDLPGLTPEQRRLARYRFRRVYASVERHNARDIGRWVRESLLERRMARTAALLREWQRHYFAYLSARFPWSPRDYERPIPLRQKTPPAGIP